MRQEGISQGLKTILLGVLNARAKEGAEKVATEEKSVPQRLKPHYKRGTYGTAEAVPLSETRLLQHPLKPGPTSEATAAAKLRQCRSYCAAPVLCASSAGALMRLTEPLLIGVRIMGVVRLKTSAESFFS